MHAVSRTRGQLAHALSITFSVALVPASVAQAAEPVTPPPGIQCSYCETGIPLGEFVLESSGPAVLTVDPSGAGETLEQEGIRLRVRIGCDGVPAAGAPGAEIVLWNPSLAWCTTPFMAAQATDADGWTEFTGTIRAGGCAERLILFADGIRMAEIPLRINSPDTGTASPGAVDAGDLPALAERIGEPARYSFCFDYNEDGAIDAGDVARFAQSLGGHCP